jgi:hypothetical protein
MRRALLLLMIVSVVAGTTGVALAAFTDTSSNSGNSFAAASRFASCYYDDAVADDPVSYWRLDETSGTTAADVEGANNGTYTNSPTLGQSGALAASTNKAVGFNGSNQYVTVPNSSSLAPTSQVTVEAWVRPNTATAGLNSQVVSKSYSSFSPPWNDYALLANGPSARPYFEMTIGGVNRQVLGNFALPTATFSHLVGTYNGSTMRLYVNGREVASASYSGAIATSGQPLQFGRLASGNNYFNGRIDEVAVYSSALSAARVLAHYNSGRCYRDEPLADNPAGYWRLGETGDSATAFDGKSTNHGTYTGGVNVGSGNLLDNASFENGTTSWSPAASTTLASVTSPVRLGSKAASVTGGGFTAGALTAASARPAASAGKTYTGWAYFRPDTTALLAFVNLVFYDSGGTQLQSTGSSTTIEVAGQWVQNSATATAPANTATVGLAAHVAAPGGTTHYIDSAQLVEDVPGGIDADDNDAASFDGSNDYVTVPHTSSLAPTSAITVEAWVKPDAIAGGYGRVVAKPYTSYAAPYNDYALVVNGAFSLPGFELTIAGTQRTQYTLPVLPTDSFSHLVGTYDGSTMKFYVNGVLTASNSYSGSIGSSGQPLQLGRLPGGNYVDGTVDEVAVYGSALSEARIQAHYIAGRAYRDVVLDSTPVSYWRLGESSGTSAADEMNAHNGTYTNGPTLAKSGAIAGNQNTAVSFDGVDDHVTTGDLSVCEGTNFSIEAWAKGTSATTNLWITSEGSTSTNNPICGLVHEGTNARFYVRDNAGTATTPTGSTGTFNDDNWHHLVGVRSGNTFTLYVDGAQAAQTTATLGAIAVDTSAIGALKRAAVGNYYPGTVDDVAIYNTALSATQAKLHYDAGKDAPR